MHFVKDTIIEKKNTYIYCCKARNHLNTHIILSSHVQLFLKTEETKQKCILRLFLFCFTFLLFTAASLDWNVKSSSNAGVCNFINYILSCAPHSFTLEMELM